MKLRGEVKWKHHSLTASERMARTTGLCRDSPARITVERHNTLHPLLHLYDGIALDVLFAKTAEISDCARHEVNIVADHPRAPGRCYKLGERTVPGLVCSQRCDERRLVEWRTIHSARHQRHTLGRDRPMFRQIQALTCRQEPEIAFHPSSPQRLSQIRESADLGPAGHCPLLCALQVIDCF